MECFFLGGLIFIGYEKIIKTDDVWNITYWLPMLAIVAWLVAILSASSDFLVTQNQAPWIVKKIYANWVVFVLFPLTIMSLALIETRRGTLGKRISFIGDISYSSYLLHFPLQLAIAIFMTKATINQEMYYSPWFMVSFYFALILISLASHRYFEVPMQHFLRLRFKV